MHSGHESKQAANYIGKFFCTFRRLYTVFGSPEGRWTSVPQRRNSDDRSLHSLGRNRIQIIHENMVSGIPLANRREARKLGLLRSKSSEGSRERRSPLEQMSVFAGNVRHRCPTSFKKRFPDCPNYIVAPNSLQAYRHDFRHSLILHGHTVDGIGRLHGNAVVGNEDDLGFFADVLNDFHEAHEVCIIQGRIDLIHQ